MKKTLILMTLAALPLAACGGGSEGGGSAAAAAAGKTAFTTQGCTVCHGETGLGDGIGAVALKVKPRNYTDAGWQGEVTDEDIKAVINGGGAANGLDGAMAAYPQITGEELDNIVAFIRSLKK